MLESPFSPEDARPGYQIAGRGDWPTAEELTLFDSVDVCNIADAQYGHGVMESAIRPLAVPGRKIVGRALTVSVTPGNGMMIRHAIDIAESGDLLVVNGYGNVDRALLGGNVVMKAIAAGIVGLVVDGSVRDRDEINELEFPVYARAVVARSGTDELGRGEVGYPIACGGVCVASGDVVIADGEGVVIVRRGDMANTASLASTIQSSKGSLANVKARLTAALEADQAGR